MGFVPYLDLSPEQQHAVRNRVKTDDLRRTRRILSPRDPESRYAGNAFWIMPDGTPAQFGMISLEGRICK